jgi:hypothetical protein
MAGLLHLRRLEMAKKTKENVDPMSSVMPFKVKKSSAKSVAACVTLPDDKASSLDTYLEAKAEIKKLEAEANMVKTDLLDYCKLEHARNMLDGVGGNINLVGGKTTGQFLVKAQGKKFCGADVEELKAEYGDEAASLLERDNSVTVNMEVYTQHREAIVNALNATDSKGNRLLPVEVVQNLFQVVLKPSSNVFEKARGMADTPEALVGLYDALGLVAVLQAKKGG